MTAATKTKTRQRDGEGKQCPHFDHEREVPAGARWTSTEIASCFATAHDCLVRGDFINLKR